MALYAFDGTWNSEKDAGRYDQNTNVVRFKDLYAGTRLFYQGVGTKHGLQARSSAVHSELADTIASAARSATSSVNSRPVTVMSTWSASAVARRWRCTSAM